jgi:tRNA(Ile)-lysidine synthase
MQRRLAAWFEHMRPASAAGPVVVGVSGGVDSMVLLEVLSRLGIELRVAHVNYGMRGEDSEADEALVRSVAEARGWRVEVEQVDGPALGEEGSFQDRARLVRYAFFERVARNEGAWAVAVGHHAEDQAETVLLQLFRGAGIEGLAGMSDRRPLTPGSPIFLLRPLLTTSRREIEAFAAAHGVPWRDDASNRGLDYRRNAVRGLVLPAIEAAAGHAAVTNVARAAERVRAYREAAFEPELARHLQDTLVDEEGRRVLVIAALRALPAIWRGRVTLEALARWSPETPRTQASADRVLVLLDAPTGRQVPVECGVFWRDRKEIVFMRACPGPVDWPEKLSPGHTVVGPLGKIALGHPREVPATLDTGTSNEVWLDADTLAFPLTVRRWQAGDRVRPLGMRGRRKVSDLLTDARVPTHVRVDWPVVLSGRTVIWVPGVKLSEEAKIEASTVRVIGLSFSPA